MALSQSDMMKIKKYSKVQKNVSALVQIFNAIPSSLFSAAAELAVLKHPRQTVGTFPVGTRFLFRFLSKSRGERVSLSGTSPLFPLEEKQRYGKTLLGGSKGVCILGRRRLYCHREGEAASLIGERWKGESEAVPPPRRFGKAKSSMPLRQSPALSIHHIRLLWDNIY